MLCGIRKGLGGERKELRGAQSVHAWGDKEGEGSPLKGR